MHEKGINQTLIAARAKVLQLHEAKAEFTKYALQDHVGSEEAKALLTVLNFREFVASGIREKAFDESMYKRMQYSVILRDWNSAQGFIGEVRKTRGRPTLFQDFEWLAKRWGKDPLELDKA